MKQVAQIDSSIAGWFNNEGLTGNKVTSISNTATGNKTYWAKWTEYSTITDLKFTGSTTTFKVNGTLVFVTSCVTDCNLANKLNKGSNILKGGF